MRIRSAFAKGLLAALVLGAAPIGGCSGSSDETPTLLCRDAFAGGVLRLCCPDPAPDCTDKPDGYPGYECVLREDQFCSCMCSRGQWWCGC
jgi:hypothetical protein